MAFNIKKNVICNALILNNVTQITPTLKQLLVVTLSYPIFPFIQVQKAYSHRIKFFTKLEIK